MLSDYLPMSTIAGSIALYFIIWWTTLFAILPFWVKGQTEGDGVDFTHGTEPGAPQHPQLLRKALVNTAVAAVVFVIVSIIAQFVTI
jgi:predicted secreted protein